MSGECAGPHEDSFLAAVEERCEERIGAVCGRLDAASSAGNFDVKYSRLLDELEALELFLWDLRRRDPTTVRVIEEFEERLPSGGSRADAVAMFDDALAVARAQHDQNIAAKYEEDPEWEEKEAQAELEECRADAPRLSASKDDLE
jgi:hypothetical protein